MSYMRKRTEVEITADRLRDHLLHYPVLAEGRIADAISAVIYALEQIRIDAADKA